MRHLLALALITVLISASGCVIPSDGVSGAGLVLEELVAEPSELQSGEPFVIRAKIRNSGGTRAENVFVKLLNTAMEEFSDISCMPSFGTTGNCEIPFDLVGEDKETGVQGESRTCAWECEAPQIEKGLKVTYNPIVRVYYSYENIATKTMLIASQDEIKRLQSQGEPIPSESITTTGGPVSVDIRLKGPLKFWEGKQQVEFPMEINIQNTGDGVACAFDSVSGGLEGCDNTENWNKVSIVSNTVDVIFDDCDLDKGAATVNLWNQGGKIVCNAWVDVLQHTTNLQKNIEIAAVYDYFFDNPIQVTVKGTMEDII